MSTNDSIQTARVALLIDADNVGDSHAGFMFEHAAAYGNVIVRKAYGVMGEAFRWKKDSLFKYAIEPVARHVYVSGKNVTDIVLVIDAMDLAHRKIADVICIASNDSDFSPLAMKLRESGVQVIGFGSDGASKAFINSCDSFIYLPSDKKMNDGADSGETKNSPPDKKTKSPAKSDAATKPVATSPQLSAEAVKILENAFDQCDNESGWVLLTRIAQYLKRVNPAFSPKDYGFGKISALMKSAGVFEVKDDKVRKKN